jgi:competence protein ComEC
VTPVAWRQLGPRLALLWPVIAALAAAWALTRMMHPPLWLGPAALILGIAGFLIVRGLGADWQSPAAVWARRAGKGLAAALIASGLGLVAVALRVAVVEAPRLGPEPRFHAVEGWLIAADQGERGTRALLRVATLSGVADVPVRVRFRLAADAAALPEPGRAVRCPVMLAGPGAPISSRDFDFPRWAWFQRLGGVGWAIGPCTPALLEAPRGAAAFDVAVAAWRRKVTKAIVGPEPDRGRALAAAFVTGDMGYVDAATQTLLRDAGLAHLLAISGVNLAMVTGFAWLVLRWGASVIPPLVARIPAQRIAAGGALIAATAYLVLSGAPVSAFRAWIMASVWLTGQLIGRGGDPMRALAVAIWVIILIEPDAALSPGFQMSFAATAAIIAVFELLHGEETRDVLDRELFWIFGVFRKAGTALRDACAASLAAGLVTAPIAAFHFARYVTHGLAANLAAGPLVSWGAAPAGIVAAAAAPLGLADPFADAMVWFIDRGLDIAGSAAGRDNAVITLAPMPAGAFVAFMAAIVVAVGARDWVRLVALPIVAVAGALWATAPKALLLWPPGGGMLLAHVETGRAPLWAVAGAPVREGGRVFRALESLTAAGDTPADLAAATGCAPGAVCRLTLTDGTMVQLPALPPFATHPMATDQGTVRCVPLATDGDPLDAAGGLWLAGPDGPTIQRPVNKLTSDQPWAADPPAVRCPIGP